MRRSALRVAVFMVLGLIASAILAPEALAAFSG